MSQQPQFLNPNTLGELRECAQIIMRVMAGRDITVEVVMYACALIASYGWSIWRTPDLVSIIGGKPGLNAHALRGLALGAGVVAVVEVDTDAEVRIAAKRGDRTYVASWTLDRATRAGYAAKNQQWRSIPRQMLHARCWSEIARYLCADVISVGDIADELGAPSADEVQSATADVAATAPYAGVTPRFSAPPTTPDPAPTFDSRAARAMIGSRLKELPWDLVPDDVAASARAALKALDDDGLRRLLDTLSADDNVEPVLTAIGVAEVDRAELLASASAREALVDCIVDVADSRAVISDRDALTDHLRAVAGLHRLWARIEADADVVLELPSVTGRPAKRAKGGSDAV